jgi:hypothetical protein
MGGRLDPIARPDLPIYCLRTYRVFSNSQNCSLNRSDLRRPCATGCRYGEPATVTATLTYTW